MAVTWLARLESNTALSKPNGSIWSTKARPKPGSSRGLPSPRTLAAIPPPTIGQGSDAATLYAACRLVRGFALSSADAAALLWEWAGGRPGDARMGARKVTHAERSQGTEAIRGLVS